jgi:hypothetical protein
VVRQLECFKNGGPLRAHLTGSKAGLVWPCLDFQLQADGAPGQLKKGWRKLAVRDSTLERCSEARGPVATQQATGSLEDFFSDSAASETRTLGEAGPNW